MDHYKSLRICIDKLSGVCFTGFFFFFLYLLFLSSNPRSYGNVMTSHQHVSFHLPLSFFTSHKSLFFFLFFKQAAPLTSQGFHVLLPSHKAETRFLLTSHENTWPGFPLVGPRSTLRSFSVPPSNVNVPICCPGLTEPNEFISH